jgi:5-formyltetrahydrofolate cyclo-ligase
MSDLSTKDKEKQAVRALIKARKQQLSKEEKVRLSEIIMQKIEQCEPFRTARSVLCYWSIADEVQLSALIEKYAEEKEILLPVVKGDVLEVRKFTGKENMRPGAFGIPEPVGEIYTGNVEVVLVPGIAFDADGRRLGRGKGYYDRFLSTTNAYKIGVGFRLQMVALIPSDWWDIFMDEVVTD